MHLWSPLERPGTSTLCAHMGRGAGWVPTLHPFLTIQEMVCTGHVDPDDRDVCTPSAHLANFGLEQIYQRGILRALLHWPGQWCERACVVVGVGSRGSSIRHGIRWHTPSTRGGGWWYIGTPHGVMCKTRATVSDSIISLTAADCAVRPSPPCDVVPMDPTIFKTNQPTNGTDTDSGQ